MPFFKKVIFPFIVIVTVFLIIFNTRQNEKTADSNRYMLKAYKNCIALYKDDRLLKIYDDIVLNTLPPKDIQSFNKGVLVSSKEQIAKILEDYDS